MKRLLTTIAALALASLLPACGGGDSDPSCPPSEDSLAESSAAWFEALPDWYEEMLVEYGYPHEVSWYEGYSESEVAAGNVMVEETAMYHHSGDSDYLDTTYELYQAYEFWRTGTRYARYTRNIKLKIQDFLREYRGFILEQWYNNIVDAAAGYIGWDEQKQFVEALQGLTESADALLPGMAKFTLNHLVDLGMVKDGVNGYVMWKEVDNLTDDMQKMLQEIEDMEAMVSQDCLRQWPETSVANLTHRKIGTFEVSENMGCNCPTDTDQIFWIEEKKYDASAEDSDKIREAFEMSDPELKHLLLSEALF